MYACLGPVLLCVSLSWAFGGTVMVVGCFYRKDWFEVRKRKKKERKLERKKTETRPT